MTYDVFIDGEYITIPRITSIISSLQCEYRSKLHYVNSGEKTPSIASISSLIGTIVHHKIEMDLSGKDKKLKLKPHEEKLLLKVERDLDFLDFFNSKIRNSYNNYEKFKERVSFEPILVEQKMIYLHKENGIIIPNKSYKGTVDLICTIYPEESTLPKSLRFETPFTTILDWKSGVGGSVPKLRSAQIEGYYELFQNSGTYEKIKDRIKYPFLLENNNLAGLVVSLGGKRYDIRSYECSGYFFKALEIFSSNDKKKVKNILKNTEWKSGNQCVFCSYRDGRKCPIFQLETLT